MSKREKKNRKRAKKDREEREFDLLEAEMAEEEIRRVGIGEGAVDDVSGAGKVGTGRLEGRHDCDRVWNKVKDLYVVCED